jgi:3-deoxy-D-manno-octulosonic acid kinase
MIAGLLTPRGFVRRTERRGEALVRADLGDLPASRWWGEGVPLAGGRGRGTVAVIDVPERGVRAAVRTYHRGGWLRRFLPAAFARGRRAERELALLAALRLQGVPVVEPLAAVRRRTGLLWQLRLATVLVERAVPLPELVAREPHGARAAVAAAGRAVGLAFSAGLLHRDLHADNLIARTDGSRVEVFLLDLDRARLRPPLRPVERDRMLLRMARYFVRHRARLAWSPSRADHVRFLRALGLDRAQRRAAIPRLRGKLRRSVARHRLAWGR